MGMPCLSPGPLCPCLVFLFAVRATGWLAKPCVSVSKPFLCVVIAEAVFPSVWRGVLLCLPCDPNLVGERFEKEDSLHALTPHLTTTHHHHSRHAHALLPHVQAQREAAKGEDALRPSLPFPPSQPAHILPSAHPPLTRACMTRFPPSHRPLHPLHFQPWCATTSARSLRTSGT